MDCDAALLGAASHNILDLIDVGMAGNIDIFPRHPALLRTKFSSVAMTHIDREVL